MSDPEAEAPTTGPYGAAVLARLREPRFAGRLPRGEAGVGTGEASDPDRGELVRVQLRAEDGRIATACFQAFGCPATIAAASLAAEWAHGRLLPEARALDPDVLAGALELGAARRRSALLAAAALAAAARDLETRPPTSIQGGTMPEPKSKNIVWSHSQVTRDERRKLLGHGAATVWFTGLSGSGKSTIAKTVERVLVSNRVSAYILDGDNVRQGLNANLGFSPEDRTENIRRIGEVARLLNDAGVIVLTAFISPYRADRDAVRAKLPDGEFVEVFVDCPIEECERRDVKGLYKKARAGEVKEFTGISAPYEAPAQPELVIESAKHDIDACARLVLDSLRRRGVITA